MDKHKPNDAVPVWLYVPGLALMVYLFLYTFQFMGGWLGDILVMGLVQLASLGIHEASHLVMMAANVPFTVVAVAGTAGQIGFVLLCLAVALWRKAYFAVAYIGVWLSYSLRHTGIYMNDALLQQLPLVTPVPSDTGQVIHDWAYMFGQWGLMPHYKVIGDTTMAIGFGVGVMAICVGGYAIVRLWCIRHVAKQAV